MALIMTQFRMLSTSELIPLGKSFQPTAYLFRGIGYKDGWTQSE